MRCPCGNPVLNRHAKGCAQCRYDRDMARLLEANQHPDAKARKNARARTKRARAKAKRDQWAGILAAVKRRVAA